LFRIGILAAVGAFDGDGYMKYRYKNFGDNNEKKTIWHSMR